MSPLFIGLKDVSLKDVGLKDVSLKDVVVPNFGFYPFRRSMTSTTCLIDTSKSNLMK